MDNLPELIEQSPPRSWVEAMDAAEADLKAGRTVSHDEVFRKLDQSIAEMQAGIASPSR